MHQDRRVPTKSRLFVLIVTVYLLYFLLEHLFLTSVTLPIFDAVRCVAFSTPMLNITSKSSRPVPKLVSDMLFFTDHVYIISLQSCSLALPKSLLSRSTCIHGQVLDSCAPLKYLRGRRHELHALKVTFTHAAIMQLAIGSGLRNVAIIEDDLEFLSERAERFSNNTISAFTTLLHSKSWAMIRFGYRPYFLQKAGSEPCPTNCRCRISPMYGFHFCQMQYHGCDMRSSDFYVINSQYFLTFQRAMLNRKRRNVDRIVDLYPMRSISKQWMFIPQVSFQRVLDIPVDYQIGSGSLFIKKCVLPRPIPPSVAEQAISVYTT
jgi:hypothetical protein